MNKNIYLMLSVLFMVFVGFQFAEPAAAVKVVDHGSKCSWNGQDGWIKINWKTYQYNDNFLKTYTTLYLKNDKNGKYSKELSESENYVLAKTAKNTLKVTSIWESLNDDVYVSRLKTKLTAAQYYWRVFRPLMMKGMYVPN
ncbi:hypothetical protein [Methanobacterium sp.]|uniref:hypothetical protein n=1 Tax=Methanobacterium sp. TaxID=2164 RepID=UPI003C77819C